MSKDSNAPPLYKGLVSIYNPFMKGIKVALVAKALAGANRILFPR
jgi:hypothetical protein